MLDLVIRDGLVISAAGSFKLDVGIQNDRIAGLYAPGDAPPSTQQIDATGLLVIPGFIDSHVHTRAPHRPDREDFSSGTRAAAAGGVTTICEMPQSLPSTHNAAAVRSRREVGERDCYVDFALWGAGAVSPEDLAGMADEGVCAFKIFLHAPMPGREQEFQGLCVADNYALYEALDTVRQTGRYCALHAEDNDLIRVLTDRLVAAGRGDPAAHCEARPPFVEHVAVAKLMSLAAELKVNLYLPHISTAGSVAMVREARAAGVDVVLETCPQYLLRDESAMASVGPYAKMNPPLRPPAEVEAVYAALVDGTVDIVGSDHSPYVLEEKERYWNDIWRALPGCPGVETLGPLLLNEALSGRLPVQRVVSVLCEGPAKAFGFYPRKGALVPGGDADVVLVDPTGEVRLERRHMFTRARDLARLFDGATLRGRIVRTLVRGVTVFEDGLIVGKPGHGRFVRPQ